MNALVLAPADVSWPAAVSPFVAPLLNGPARLRRVIGAFTSCVYVEMGAHERVIAVHTPDAVQLPIGVRLSGPVRLDELVCPGDLVTVGGGRVRLPGADVVAVRRSRLGRVGAGGGTASRAWHSLGVVVPGAELRPDPDGLDAVAHRLCTAAVTGRPVQALVDQLVGAGRALTPSGDDLLCGILLTLRAFAGPTTGALEAAQRAVLSRLHGTTSISAALIVAAARGWAAPDVTRLLALIGGRRPPHPAELSAVFHRLPCIGHTSGADLLAGVTATVTALMSLGGPVGVTSVPSARRGRSEAIGA